MTVGDVVRVVLLFYLMPLWAVLLARLLLDERSTALALLRVALALAGAAVVLWPQGGGWPLPRSLADWLGVVGGFAFALNNVMLRREAHRPTRRARWRCSSAARCCRRWPRWRSASPAPGRRRRRAGSPARWRWRCCSWSATWRCSTARRGCRPTSPRWCMVSEVLFAAVGALALGAGRRAWRSRVGGALIVAAALLAALRPVRRCSLSAGRALGAARPGAGQQRGAELASSSGLAR